jgi:phosphoglycolate phosphatase-like HAD superfamily hydrolase
VKRLVLFDLDGTLLSAGGVSARAFDVLCGRHLGVRAVAVATGRTSVAALRAVEPHALLESFADREPVRAILGEEAD